MDESSKRGVNPRLIDFFRLNFTQDDVDFAIPHLQEDISLYLDPFLLWKSDLEQYQHLHSLLLTFFEHLREEVLAGRRVHALETVMQCRELREIGLGYSLGSKSGSSIGPMLADRILDVYEEIPQVQDTGLNHIEVLGLVVPKLAEDRISDLTAAILKGFFVSFSEDRAREHGIPTKRFQLDGIYDFERRLWKPMTCNLPFNPLDDTPLLLAPLNLLRHLPWINYADYYRSRFAHLVLPAGYRGKKLTKEQVLALNRKSYVAVERYVADREDAADACRPAPLFEPLKLETLLKKYSQLRKLPTGKTAGSDKRYEQLAYELLSSLLYPELEFAEDQVRTVSGVHIRDIIFYNDGKTAFLHELRELYDARQPVFELKNVSSLDGGHVNQLYRYLDPLFGRFGVLVNRLPLPKSVWKNVVDLHSSKRAVILALDDSDLELMISMLASGRRPIDVIKKRYIEFTRLLPK